VSRDAYLPLPSYSVIAADTLSDLVTFDLGQWSDMAGHVVNPSTKFEDSTAIRSWAMSSDISHRIPLTLRLQPLHMRRITWPMRRGQIFARIFEIPDPNLPIHYGIQLLWRYDDV